MATALDYIDLSLSDIQVLASDGCWEMNIKSPNEVEWVFHDGSKLTLNREKLIASKDGYTKERRF